MVATLYFIYSGDLLEVSGIFELLDIAIFYNVLDLARLEKLLFMRGRVKFCLFDLQTVASRFLASPSLQDRLKETTQFDGNHLIGQSILPTNESVPITQACLFQSVLQTGSSVNPSNLTYFYSIQQTTNDH
jgi:hypothetical protein